MAKKSGASWQRARARELSLKKKTTRARWKKGKQGPWSKNSLRQYSDAQRAAYWKKKYLALLKSRSR